MALKTSGTIDAVESFRAAFELTHLWLARFSLGVVYVEAGGHDAEAFVELDACVKRSGEATSISLDDVPTFRYWAMLPDRLGPGAGRRRLDAQRGPELQAVSRRGPDAARDPPWPPTGGQRLGAISGA